MLDAQHEAILAKASRQDVHGWHHVKISGAPYELGYQHGYLLADALSEALRVYDYMTLQTFGMPYSFFVESAVRLHKDKIPDWQLEEMRGIAEGATDNGCPIDLDGVIGWNAWMELTDYWWPLVAANYANNPPKSGPKGSHCSGFVATGSYTRDGRPVIAHEAFDDFWAGQNFNVIEEVSPSEGNRFIMQTVPGYIASMMDFYVTSGGIAITETTIAGFRGYDETKTPEYVRARDAAQFANSIDEFVERIERGNNGGYANIWFVADAKTGEVARYEQGLQFQQLVRTKDGFLVGCNAADDPRVRNLECVDNGYNDPRQQTGARRLRFKQIIPGLKGKMDAEQAKLVLADTFDPYLGYDCPSSRNICAHYDADPQYFADDPGGVWNVPFYPAGSVDGKCAEATDIDNVAMWARFGRADGVPFDADAFLEAHPQWDWQAGYLKSRPHEPWTHF